MFQIYTVLQQDNFHPVWGLSGVRSVCAGTSYFIFFLIFNFSIFFVWSCVVKFFKLVFFVSSDVMHFVKWLEGLFDFCHLLILLGFQSYLKKTIPLCKCFSEENILLVDCISWTFYRGSKLRKSSIFVEVWKQIGLRLGVVH